MKNRAFIFLIFLLLFPLLTLLPAPLSVSAWSGEILWHITGSAVPGGTVQLELEFHNTGSTELLIESVSLSGWGYLERSLNVTVPSGSTSYLGVFYVQVPENATAGVHKLELTLLMRENLGGRWVSRKWSVPVPIKVVRYAAKPLLNCKVLNETYAGGGVLVTLGCNLSNLGNTSLRGNLSLSSGEWSRNVEVELPPNSTKGFIFTLVSQNPAEVKVVFRSPNLKLERVLKLAPPTGPNIEVASMDYTVAYPGCSVPVSLQLRNSGNKPGNLTLTLVVDNSSVSSLYLIVPPGGERKTTLYWNVPLDEPPGIHRALVSVCLPQGCSDHPFNLTVLPGGMPEVSREFSQVMSLRDFLTGRNLGKPPKVCDRALSLWASLNSTGDPELINSTISALRKCFLEMKNEACNSVGNMSSLEAVRQLVERARSSSKAGDVVGNLTEALKLVQSEVGTGAGTGTGEGRGGAGGSGAQGGRGAFLPHIEWLVLALLVILVLMVLIASRRR